MEYALPSHNYHTTAELNGGDLFSMPLSQATHDAVSAVQPAASHQYAESISSESQLNPIVASLNAQQKAHMQQPMVAAQTAPKVKRQDDVWTGSFYSSLLDLFLHHTFEYLSNV